MTKETNSPLRPMLATAPLPILGRNRSNVLMEIVLQVHLGVVDHTVLSPLPLWVRVGPEAAPYLFAVLHGLLDEAMAEPDGTDGEGFAPQG